jgi:hypothetical protein
MGWEEKEKKSEKIEWPQLRRHLLRFFFFTGHYPTAFPVGSVAKPKRVQSGQDGLETHLMHYINFFGDWFRGYCCSIHCHSFYQFTFSCSHLLGELPFRWGRY